MSGSSLPEVVDSNEPIELAKPEPLEPAPKRRLARHTAKREHA